MNKEEIISLKLQLVDGEIKLTSFAKKEYQDILHTIVGVLASYLESKHIARPKEDIGYEVYLVKAKMTLYANDFETKSEERQKEKYMKVKDYPDFPILIEQIEEILIEPHMNILGKSKDVETVKTSDGEYREVVRDAEMYFIYKIPCKFHLDIREVEEIASVLDVGLGEYGSYEVLDIRHLGKNYY